MRSPSCHHVSSPKLLANKDNDNDNDNLTSITVTQAQLDKSVKTARHYMSATLKNVQNNERDGT
jgi:hypothetical protein